VEAGQQNGTATMAERKRIGLREVRSLGPNQEVWDAAVPGFGARRQRSTAVAYVLLYRTSEGRTRRHTIGGHGAPWTPDTAREEARRLLGAAVTGADPAADKKTKRRAKTVTELCELYWADAEAGRLLTRRKAPKKASTLRSDMGRVEKHIKPLLGRMKVTAVTREDVEQFMHAVAEGKTAARAKTGKKRGLSNVRGGMGTASRTLGLLGAIFTYAVRHRMRADNPVHGVPRPADGKRQRRLSDGEYAALGAALRQAEAEHVWPAAVAAARLLALTGWRSGEALGLRWADVDLARRTAVLADTKTGRSVRPLSHAACGVLRSLGRGADASLVFPPTRGKGTMTGFRKLWDRIARFRDLPADMTPHGLRHSFASLAGDMGYSEPTIAALVGHQRHTITSRYVHPDDGVLLAAANAIANETARRMGDSPNEAVIGPMPASRVSQPQAERAMDSIAIEDASAEKRRMPSGKHYEALMAVLAGIGQRPDVDRLERSYAALRAVVAYFDSSADISIRDLMRPLHALIHALSDSLRGGQPALLRPRRRGTGPPKDQSFSSIQGAVAAALEIMVRAGMQVDSAARLVTTMAHSHGIRDRNGQRLTAAQAINWRHRAGDDLAPTGTAAFKQIASLRVADQEQGKEYVREIIGGLVDGGLGADRDFSE
jgi:integrase